MAFIILNFLKGLIEAFNQLMLGVEHHFYVKHMYDNFKVIFRGLEYKKKLWAASCAIRKRTWEYHMTKIKEMDVKAYDWLMKHDPSTWSRAHFSTHAKSDVL